MTGGICWKIYKQMIDGASENPAVRRILSGSLGWCGERLRWNSPSSLRIAQPSCLILTPALPKPALSSPQRNVMEVKPSENISHSAAAVSVMDCTSGSMVKCTAERNAQNVMFFFFFCHLYWILLQILYNSIHWPYSLAFSHWYWSGSILL